MNRTFTCGEKDTEHIINTITCTYNNTIEQGEVKRGNHQSIRSSFEQNLILSLRTDEDNNNNNARRAG